MYVNFLGVYVDELLNWDSHCKHLILSISRSIGILNKLRYDLCRKTLLLLYNSLILSKLSYCNIMWGTTCKRNIDSIFILQKKGN